MKTKMNTLDWEKVEEFIAKRKPLEVSVGLLGDWFMTAATCYEKGGELDRSKGYATSFWATPGFKAVMKNGDTIEVVASRPYTKDDEKADNARRKKDRAVIRRMARAIEKEKAAKGYPATAN